jgi:ribosomal protein L7/L12
MKVIIMMGLPGSGKSTWAKAIKGSKIIVSSDNYFTDPDGNYHWSVEEAHKGHEDCLRRFINVFQPGPISGDPERRPDTVIVDNTNVRIHDVSPYIRIAQVYGCDVEVKCMDTDIDVAKSRNVHNVPDSAYDRIQKNFEFLFEVWPKDFPPIEFVYGSIDDGSPNEVNYKVIPIYGAAPAYGCLAADGKYGCEDKTEFDVVLTEVGMNKLRVIRWVRENTDLSLAASKELVENAPKNVLSGISKWDADLAKQGLEFIGAKVEIR